MIKFSQRFYQFFYRDMSQTVKKSLSRNVEESFKEFWDPDPDPEADAFQNLIDSSSFIDTPLTKHSWRSNFGDRCFATARPTLWNSLPEQFKRSLKTSTSG